MGATFLLCVSTLITHFGLALRKRGTEMARQNSRVLASRNSDHGFRLKEEGYGRGKKRVGSGEKGQWSAYGIRAAFSTAAGHAIRCQVNHRTGTTPALINSPRRSKAL
jgi:hypothetical protein